MAQPPSHVPTPHKGDIPPITWSAFEYDYAYDSTPDSYQGNCHDFERDDGVDGMYTSVSVLMLVCLILLDLSYPLIVLLHDVKDEVCMERDDSYCNIAWTREHGESFLC